MTGSSTTSVSTWLRQLKEGDEDAAHRVWLRYLEDMLRVADQKLGHAPRSVADEDDVAVTAFRAFVQGAREGRFPDLQDRQDLWQVLFMLTERKAGAQRKRELAQKRGEGKVIHEAGLRATADDRSNASGFAGMVGEHITPEFAAMMSEQLQLRLGQLASDVLRQIALKKMEGYTNADIAAALGVVTRTVERKLDVIRTTWFEEEDLV